MEELCVLKSKHRKRRLVFFIFILIAILSLCTSCSRETEKADSSKTASLSKRKIVSENKKSNYAQEKDVSDKEKDVSNQEKDVSNQEKWRICAKKASDSYGIRLYKIKLLDNMNLTLDANSEDLKYGYGERLPYSILYLIAQTNNFENYTVFNASVEDNEVSTQVFCDRNKKRIIKLIQLVSDETKGKEKILKRETDKYKINEGVINTLRDADVSVYYNNFKISKETVPGGMLQRLGNGSANESNNYGLVTRFEGKERREYAYPVDNHIFSVIVSGYYCSEAPSHIQSINLYSTIRGLHPGDNYSKLIKLYGNPNLEICKTISDCELNSERIEHIYVYKYNDKQLEVTIDNNKISNIIIEYENLYNI